jgi:hypothetical protein
MSHLELYEKNMSHPEFLARILSHPEFFLVRKNSFLPDLSELKAKKSAIFSLSIHSNQVKKDVAFAAKSLILLVNPIFKLIFCEK